MRLAQTIYTLRTQKGMSQGDLADALEVSRQSVSKWETGGATPDLDKLVKMSELFGVTLDELVTGDASFRSEKSAHISTIRRNSHRFHWNDAETEEDYELLRFRISAKGIYRCRRF